MKRLSDLIFKVIIMKILSLPHTRSGYISTGIKALPPDKRKQAFENLSKKTTESPDLADLRLKHLMSFRN